MLTVIISRNEAGSSLVQLLQFVDLINFVGVPNTASIFHHGPNESIVTINFSLAGAFLNVAL